MSDILLVCQANQCRSPMGEALLRHRLREAGVTDDVCSAGLSGDGQPAAPGAVRALAQRGLDLAGHRSRQVDEALVEPAAMVIGLERRHVREVVMLVPDAWPRAFTLKELVRRGEQTGPRRRGEPAEAWRARVHAGRRLEDLVGEDPRDDVEDPMGRAAADYRRTADDLDDLCGRLVALLVA